MNYKIDLSEQTVDSLVIACSDFRFQQAIRGWIDEKLDGKADLIIWPGASKAVVSNPKELSAAVSKLNQLHGETNIYILDHIDCGAYRGSKNFIDKVDELKSHKQEMNHARELLLRQFNNFEIEGYLIDEKTIIKLI